MIRTCDPCDQATDERIARLVAERDMYLCQRDEYWDLLQKARADLREAYAMIRRLHELILALEPDVPTEPAGPTQPPDPL